MQSATGPTSEVRSRPSPEGAPRARARAAAASLALALALLAAPCASAAAPGPAFWEALYRGDGSPAPTVLDLTLTGTAATARLLLPDRAATLQAAGSAAADGSVRLTLHDAAGNAVGVLQGRRSQAPNDDGGRFTGSLTLGGRATTLTLTRFAQVARWDVQDGPIAITVRYPRFESADLEALNAVVETRARADLAAFLAEGRQAQSKGQLFHAWQLVAETRLEGLVGNTVSLLGNAYRYTGGAHGNTTLQADTWQLDGPAPRALTLAELFRPGAPYLERLAGMVLADLRAQNATWVVDGEVSQLTAHDLALFDLTPDGLAFRFPPYAMGPYVQGIFTVVVPYAAVLDLALPGGPLQAYARTAP